MLKKFSLQKFSSSFFVALGVHLVVFALIGFSMPSQEIAFGDASADKNLITFDLGSMSFGGKAGGGQKNLKGTPRENPKTAPQKSSSRTLEPSAPSSNQATYSNTDSLSSATGNATAGGGSGDGSGEGIGSGSGSEGRFQGAVSNYKEPQYPPMAIKRNLQGTAIIKINILGNGDVQSFEILQSTGHQILDNAVLDAVKNWKFKAHPRGMGYFVKKTVVFILR